MEKLMMFCIGLLLCPLVWGNIVLNPGFETQSGGFAQYWARESPTTAQLPVIEADNTVFYSGAYSVRMYGNGNRTCYGRVKQSIVAKAGQTYQFSAKVRAQNIYSLRKSVFIKLIMYQTTGNLGTRFVDQVTPATGEWMTFSRILTTPANTNRIEIYLEMRWTAEGTVWWDDIVLEEIATPPSRQIKVGTVYCNPSGSSVANNLTLFGGLLDQAGAAGCDIVCLPEGWATVGTSVGWQKDAANQIPGSASNMVAGKASQYNMYVVAGFYMWEAETLYNVAALFDRGGQVAGIYKKVHLPNSETEGGIVPGDSFPVFTTDFGTIGIQICWDNAFPEVARILALKGAEIIFCPIWGDIRGWDTAQPIQEQPDAMMINRVRAMDNGVFYINSIYHGHSVIIDPGGRIRAETSGSSTQLITATIDLNYNPPWEWLGAPAVGEWKSVLKCDRRADTFGELSSFITTPQASDTTGGGQKKTAAPVNKPVLSFANPLTGQTIVEYCLTGEALGQKFSLTVTDANGGLVRSLAAGILSKPKGQAVWDRKDEGGNEVCDGVYLCKLQFGNREFVQKMVLIK